MNHYANIYIENSWESMVGQHACIKFKTHNKHLPMVLGLPKTPPTLAKWLGTPYNKTRKITH